VFVLSGTTTGGHHATVAERAATVDIWAKALDPSRVVACCWTSDDLTEAHRRDGQTWTLTMNSTEPCKAGVGADTARSWNAAEETLAEQRYQRWLDGGYSTERT
jgi:hypothetical protein